MADRAEAAGAPSANGELVFEEPWQGRVLSMAVHLSDVGEFAWDDFRARLIRVVDAHPDEPYYVQFLAALEDALMEEGLLARADIADRVRAIQQTAHQH